MPTAVNVFEYLDYREFLRDAYAHKKATEYGFSHRAFSRRAGLRSTNFLKLVMDEKRRLSLAVAPRFASALGLSGEETEYFLALVAYGQADTAREKEHAYERIRRLKPQREVREIEAHQSAYHSRWYIPVIRELAARRDFRDDPAWIAGLLVPKITPAQAKRALATLESLGLLRRTRGGKLRPATGLVSTGLEPLGHHIASFHRAMLERAGEAIDLVPRDEREIASLTLCVDESVIPVLKSRLQAFRRELLQQVEALGTPRRVVQVSFQMFPLSKKED